MTMRLRVWTIAAAAAVMALALASAAATAAASKHKKAKQQTTRSAAHTEPARNDANYLQRDDVMRFGIEIAERNGLDTAWVLAALADARYQPSVARLIAPPPAGTAKNWAAYRARFVEPRRIAAGVAFWRANEGWLLRAEDVYGVPPEIVVGIVGVETIFGQQMGGYRVIDALATLAFDYPAAGRDRSAFFRAELEQLFIHCRSTPQRAGCDPLALRGSYAGAFGMPQFMPGSINRHAVDFDADGRIDLRDSSADVIGSVAHYLAEYGWRRGVPTRFDVAVFLALLAGRPVRRGQQPAELRQAVPARLAGNRQGQRPALGQGTACTAPAQGSDRKDLRQVPGSAHPPDGLKPALSAPRR